MYAARTSLGPVDVAFSDAEQDLADRGPGEGVAALAADFAPGTRVHAMRQVHGADVVRVGADEVERPTCDALVTTAPDVALVVRVADCVPVLLADPAAGVVGAVHSGRPGVAARVVPAAVAAMRDLGAQEITAWIGPHVCGGCYEVPQDLQDEVAAIEPATRATTTWGTPSLDIGAGVRAQLERDGVAYVDLSRCTRESADLHSYRRDGAASGRMAGLVRRHGT